jgi:hypothetical protein
MDKTVLNFIDIESLVFLAERFAKELCEAKGIMVNTV